MQLVAIWAFIWYWSSVVWQKYLGLCNIIIIPRFIRRSDLHQWNQLILTKEKKKIKMRHLPSVLLLQILFAALLQAIIQSDLVKKATFTKVSLCLFNCVHEWGIFNVLIDALVRKLCMKMLKFIRLICALLQTKLVQTSLVFLVCHDLGQYLLCDPI